MDKIVLCGDAGPFKDYLDRLRSLVEALDSPGEVIDGLLGILDAPEKLFRFKVDPFPTGGTNQYLVRLEPTDFAAVVMAAVRTGNINGLVVKDSGHRCRP